MVRRLIQLYAGLVVFAFGEALVVEATLGIMPWDVLHQGLVNHFGLTIGIWSIIVGVIVLLLWIPLRERPGFGTVMNVLIIGAALDLSLYWLPTPEAMWLRIGFLLGGIVINGIATAAYIGARFGTGPRDGLMTGLHRTTGRSIRLVRTFIEVTVVIVGWLLGGNLGIGTLVFAVLIGPVINPFLPMLTVPERTRPGPTPPESEARGN